MKWKDRIKNAKKRGRFLSKDIVDSQYWNRCAVGEKFKLFNMREDEIDAMSFNNRIFDLGLDFSYAVDGGEIDIAAKLLKKICSLKDSALKRV